MSFIVKLLEGAMVAWKPLEEVFDISAGGDKPKDAISEIETEEFCVPILSNGKGDKAIYGWTNKAKIDKPSLTVSARGTIGWTNIWEKPFYPIIRLIVLTPKIELNLKYTYYLMKSVECSYKVPVAGIPQLTKPMIKHTSIPIPCPDNPEKSLKIQNEIVRILDSFTKLTAELTAELTVELRSRKQQYSYYREQLLNFDEREVLHLPMGDKSIGKFQRGKRFVKTDMISEGVPCIHYGEMYTHYDTWADNAKSFLSHALVLKKNLRVAEKGDVVIVAAGETIEDIGKGTAWLGDEGVVIHDACFSYISEFNPKYVAYFTRTRQFHDQIRKHIRTGKISAINADGLGKAIIPVPSPEEQERIVSILDKFDALTTSISEGLPKEIALRQKQYEYYRELLLTFPKNKIEE